MVVKQAAALISVAEHALRIAANNPRIADRFFNSVEHTLHLLEHNPQVGTLFRTDHPELQGIRKLRVAGFPRHLIFYQPIKGGIRFIKLLHTSRNIPKALQEE